MCVSGGGEGGERGHHTFLWLAARPRADFRGTSLYASLNAHDGKDLGRRDDLWCVFYMLVDLLRPCLPWRSSRKLSRDEVHRQKKVSARRGGRGGEWGARSDWFGEHRLPLTPPIPHPYPPSHAVLCRPLGRASGGSAGTGPNQVVREPPVLPPLRVSARLRAPAQAAARHPRTARLVGGGPVRLGGRGVRPSRGVGPRGDAGGGRGGRRGRRRRREGDSSARQQWKHGGSWRSCGTAASACAVFSGDQWGRGRTEGRGR